MTTELEHLNDLEIQLQAVWAEALVARDGAQSAMEHVTAMKQRLTKRQIEIKTAQLAERQAK